MKKFYLFFAIIISTLISSAQIQIDTTKTALELAQIFAGTGIQVSNATYSGTLYKPSIGYFNNAQTTNLEFSSGIVITTGKTIDIPQAASSLSSSNNNLLGGDSLLSLIGGGTSFNTGFLEFDFMPSGDSIEMLFIFASEEYPEYVCSQFSDAIGIFISGEYPVDTFFTNKNLALVPGTNFPVSINSINQGSSGTYGSSANCVSLNYSNLFVENTNGTSIVFDGLTVPLKAKAAVIPGKTYHIRIAIADIADGSFDSGLFLKAHSLISTPSNVTNDLCVNSQAICFATNDTIPFNINTIAEYGPNYGCLYTQPNPMWFNIQISQPGDLIFNLTSPTGNDIDFVCWGPFNDPTSPCTAQLTANCSSCPDNTSNPNFYPSGNMVDCSYSPASYENIHISNALIGQYYIIMVTNYANQQGYMVISQTNAGQPGAGSVSCLPLPQCNIDTISLTVGNCDSLNRYEITGMVYATNAPINGSMIITDISSNTVSVLPVSGNNSIPFTIKVPFSSGNPELKIEFTEGSCSKTIAYQRPKRPTLTSNIGNSTCGQSNGYIIIGITADGIPNYSYHWSTGQNTNNTPNTSSFIQNIPAGHYEVSVYNANQCYSVFTYNMINTGAPDVSIQLETPNICSEDCNATLTATSNSQNFPLTYHWSNGIQFIDTTGIGSKDSLLCNGTYFVTVTDVNNCATVAQYMLNHQNTLSVNIQNIHFPNCLTSNNGFIEIQAVGGVSPYTYLWSTQPLQTSNTAVNLGEGTYQYTVTDAQGCHVIDSITLVYSNLLTVNTVIYDPICGSDGEIILQVSGGTPPYNYNWNSFPNNHTNTLTNITGGTYTYTVTDASGCQLIEHATLNNQTTPLVADLLNTFDYCSGTLGGMAVIAASGGTPPYYDGFHYFNSVDTIYNLSAGFYTINITDTHHCNDSLQIQISEKPKPQILGYVSQSNCGMSDGSIIVQINNGIAPYNYYWSNGLVLTNTNNPVIMNSNLPADVYFVTVTHGNGCSADTFFVVNNQTALSLVVDSTTPPSCVDYADACITVHAANGTPPYNFVWSNGCNSTTCCGLSAGNYTITINDASNCSQVAVVTVPQGQQPIASFSFTQQQNTIIFINESSQGNYLWIFGDGTSSTEANPIHTYLNNGQYTACLMLYSCDTLIACHTIEITSVGLNELLNNSIYAFPNPTNNYFIIKTNSNDKIHLQLYNAIMQKVLDKNIYSEEKIYINNLPAGIYFLQLAINNKQIMTKLIIER